MARISQNAENYELPRDRETGTVSRVLCSQAPCGRVSSHSTLNDAQFHLHFSCCVLLLHPSTATASWLRPLYPESFLCFLVTELL